MPKLILFITLGLAAAFSLSACAQDVRQEVFTTDDRAQVNSDVVNSTELSDKEKLSFARETLREGYQPYGKTVAAILNDAQRDDASDRAAAAAKAAQARALDGDLEYLDLLRYPSLEAVTTTGRSTSIIPLTTETRSLS